MFNHRELELGSCYCGTTEDHIYDTMSGSDICQRCGVVVEQVLYDGAEYNYTEQGEDVGFHGLENYTTFIDDGRHLTKRLQASLMTNEEKISKEQREVISIIGNAFKIERDNIILNTANHIADMHREKIKLNGRKKIASFAAAFYFACKIHGATREIRTISNMCCIDVKTLNFGIKSIRENLTDSQYMSAIVETTTHHTIAERFINMTIDDVSQKQILRKNVLNMVDSMSAAFETGRKPRTVVSAIIIINMFMLNIKFDKKTFSANIGICSQSIDTAIRDLKKEYNLIF